MTKPNLPALKEAAKAAIPINSEATLALIEALEMARKALSAHNPECAACGGSGYYQVGTGYPNGDGGEETMAEQCDCCVDKEALAAISEKIDV